MKLSQLFTKSRKEVPADETARNAQLLIKAGFIHKQMAGAYDFLPLGLKVLDNIAEVVRQEMNQVGGQEVKLTSLQRKDLWERTGRWSDEVVDDWFKTKLANDTELGLGLTHEEPLTDLLVDYVNSYKDLPLLIYQIQTKFRNELRAKSGILRGREFLMKDMYSFARNQAEHEEIYDRIKQAYVKVYDRLGIGQLTYPTFASGGIFSKFSDEFQTVTVAGEDQIFLDKNKKVAVNSEVNNDEVLQDLGLARADLKEQTAAEVGNIFNLGSKYSKALGLEFTDEKGNRQPVIMGCYGIGISRCMGVIAEVLSDEKGLVWPESIAPAKAIIVQIGSDEAVNKSAEKLYKDLTEAKVEVIYDDRDMRPGEKFADADLMGIPYRVVVSDKTIAKHEFEVKRRTEDTHRLLTAQELLKVLT
ncbi:MAG: aminoacyl--tRNA ligase-related protein [Candidatus Saccharimonadales bacterium]